MGVRVAIIDYDLGNLRSVQKAFERLGHKVIISRDAEILNCADKLVLPGVGHFSEGMTKLKKYGLVEQLNHLVLHKRVPILGICLGMQLMTKFSEEGMNHGLGWVDAQTLLFQKNSLTAYMKVPHMGWNTICNASDHKITNNITINDQFYFTHSYFVKCEEINQVLFTTEYGVKFDSGFKKENIMGIQFHPEKSHKSGLKILKNFIEF
jgi:glutamine amidotransferase